jgi:hypothetical protein
LPDTREKAAFLTGNVITDDATDMFAVFDPLLTLLGLVSTRKLVGKKIYMYGGVKPYQTVLKDFWTLDTETWTWQRGPDGPGPRADHTLLQYYEYIFVVSGKIKPLCLHEITATSAMLSMHTHDLGIFLIGYNVSRNVPLTETLPLMVFDTNTTIWTDEIRPTLDAETTYVSNVTRAAIIIGTVIFAVVLMVIALSTHLLRKWNQRNYTKGYENVELEEQRRRAAQELPSILKKRYLSEGGNGGNGGPGSNVRSGRNVGIQSEVLFEDEEGDYSDHDNGSFDGDDEYEDDQHHSGQKVSLLSRSQPNPKSRPLQEQQQSLAPPQRERRVRIQELSEEEEEEGEEDGSEFGTLGEDDDDDDDGSAVIVRLPPYQGMETA